ncbi:hypothetical protein ABKN59_011203 [Abortiporus biennis]
MHPCLQIHEIFSVIAELASYTPYSSVSKGSPHPVCALIRTCRTFYEPACDILWRNIPGLVPLFRLFPDELLQIDADDLFDYEQYMFTRIPTAHDWERFLHHSSRVRTFSPPSFSKSSISPDALLLLQQQSPTSPMFPKLQRLYWRDTCEINAWLPLIASPRLTKIECTTLSTKATALSFLDALRKYCISPSIHLVRIGGMHFPEDPEVTKALSDLICQWHQLEELVVDGNSLTLSDNAIVHLASLPTLKKADFALSSQSQISAVLGTHQFTESFLLNVTELNLGNHEMSHYPQESNR